MKINPHFKQGFLDGWAIFGYSIKAFLACYRRLLVKGDSSIFQDVDDLWLTSEERLRKQRKT
jgi:hypothetical protein